MPTRAKSANKARKKISGVEIYAIIFGFFLGLCIWKFGNPVILDEKISSPASLAELWNYAWPTHWANWIFPPLTLAGIIFIFTKKTLRPISKWLLLLPLCWFGWQMISATQTVDADLTAATLWQFFGCVICYFLGALLFGNRRALRFLLIGILIAFVCCLVKAVDQRLFEFPESRQLLVEGERVGWTNIPPQIFLEMKQENVVIVTNGAEIANPAVLTKFAKGRVNGTLVYPNALAGIILLLFPISIALVFGLTQKMRPAI